VTKCLGHGAPRRRGAARRGERAKRGERRMVSTHADVVIKRLLDDDFHGGAGVGHRV
jgi:hypothetical protein